MARSINRATVSRAAAVALTIAVNAALAGCASKEDVIPQDGPDMLEIYRTHTQGAGLAGTDALSGGRGHARAIADGERDLHGYTRSAVNEIEQRFPLLPNPVLVMYVFPHLSSEGAPVPGYTTAFPMYEADHFAEPGEGERP